MHEFIATSSGGVRIHALDSEGDGPDLLPLLICPGLSMTAEEYLPFMERLAPRRCIALSFRGRGRSGTPDAGYSLEDHLSDVIAVREAAGLDRYHLYGYSRGVSYALALARHEPKRNCLAYASGLSAASYANDRRVGGEFHPGLFDSAGTIGNVPRGGNPRPAAGFG